MSGELGRLGELGAALAEQVPNLAEATLGLVEMIGRALGGARAGSYEIAGPIGTGGMAEVFLGFVRGEAGFARPVAIKRVRADRAGSARLAVKLTEEALLTARLAHPNVVAVLDFVQDTEGGLCLVMEHIDGLDLARLVATGPIPPPVAIYIMRELLAALAYLHELPDQQGGGGLVHRDITPHNVLLSWRGEVKLADFGIAATLERYAVDEPLSGGTVGYMSPEQSRSERLDGRSDLYAAGILLWEILAGRRLFDEPRDVLRRKRPRAPSKRGQRLPVDLAAVVGRLLSYDPGERYPSAALAAADLLSCQDHPRDGRGGLVRLLDERFPPVDRARPPVEPGSPPSGPSTLTDS